MFIIVMQLVCLSVVLGEPHCSPFHYHEQLLEKMVDVKYKMEKYSGKMDKWENEISETLKQFEEAMTELQKKETRRDGTIEQLKSDVNDTLEKFSKSTKHIRHSMQGIYN